LFRRTWQSRHQTPTLIGCMLLTNPARTSSFAPSLLAHPAAISEALDYDRFFEALSSCFLLSSSANLLAHQFAAVVSGALDSIPTFDRLPSPQLIFFAA